MDESTRQSLIQKYSDIMYTTAWMWHYPQWHLIITHTLNLNLNFTINIMIL